MTARLLITYMNNQPVGELRQEGPDLSCCYEGGYLSRANALPLSRHLTDCVTAIRKRARGA